MSTSMHGSILRMSKPADAAGTDAAVDVNGWAIYAHPVFYDQFDELMEQVAALRQKDPAGYIKKNAFKRLAAIQKLVYDVIPQDPTRPEYRQGDTLGEAHKHWFRAKFFQQYRLFFRYSLEARVIVFAWVNDDASKRAYGSSDDAYKIFRRMLKNGVPPDSWDALLAEARKATSARTPFS